MPSSRGAIAMSESEVAEFLAGAGNIILVTNGPDGFPDPVAMWFVLDDDRIWMRTYASSQKVRNLERDPRCALLAEAGARYAELRGVQLTAEARVHRDPDRICAIVADLMVKYEGLDPAHRGAAAEAYRPRAPKQVAIEFEVVGTASWDHRKLGSGG